MAQEIMIEKPIAPACIKRTGQGDKFDLKVDVKYSTQVALYKIMVTVFSGFTNIGEKTIDDAGQSQNGTTVTIDVPVKNKNYSGVKILAQLFLNGSVVDSDIESIFTIAASCPVQAVGG